MRKWLLVLLLLPLGMYAQDLELFNGCPMKGHVSAKLGAERKERMEELNKLKNRFHTPTNQDLDTTITLADLIGNGSQDRDSFDVRKAVSVQGYIVYAASRGSIESCNCQAKEVQYQDQHIEIALRPDEPKGARTLVVEITPRMRYLMRQQGVNWSHSTLAKWKGKKVRVTGWLLYDFEHENASCNMHPEQCGGEGYNRQTCWEIHPVTDIRVIR